MSGTVAGYEYETALIFPQSKQKFDWDSLLNLMSVDASFANQTQTNFTNAICTKHVNQQRIAIKFWLQLK